MTEIAPPTTREVSRPLGVGILLAPYVFAWFTLRRGYSARTKQVAFAWMAIVIVILSLADRGAKPTPPPPQAAARTVRDSAAVAEPAKKPVEQPAQSEPSNTEAESLARSLGLNERGIGWIALIATRYDVPNMKVLDMSVKVGQLCLEQAERPPGISEDSLAVVLAANALGFVERVSAPEGASPKIPLADAFAAYKMSGCPM